ncbi:MAG: hypothetical protein SNJ84_00830 [Verrucomicrobiia bacterium]
MKVMGLAGAVEQRSAQIFSLMAPAWKRVGDGACEKLPSFLVGNPQLIR